MQKTVVVSKPLDAVFGYLSDEAVWASLSRVTRVRAVAAGRLALGQLDKERLAYEVALESDSPDFTRHLREEALIRTVTHLTDTHEAVQLGSSRSPPHARGAHLRPRHPRRIP